MEFIRKPYLKGSQLISTFEFSFCFLLLSAKTYSGCEAFTLGLDITIDFGIT